MQSTANHAFADFLTHLRTLSSDPQAAAQYARAYIADNTGNFPIIEGNTAHFLLAAQPGARASVGGEWNGFDSSKAPMTYIGGGILHYAHDFEPDARLDYLFFVSDPGTATLRSIRDPLNPRTGESGYGLRSELAMPGYQRPYVTTEQPGVQPGTLHEKSIARQAFEEQRPYTVYLPRNYNPLREPYPSVYFHDGGDYITMGNAPVILDNLIAAGAIPPLVAVFVPPVERHVEYNCDSRYLRFICDELVPEMQRTHNLIDDPANRAIIGPSLGGLISLYIAGQRPGLFGLVGAQSTVVECWDSSLPFDARAFFTNLPGLPLRIHMVIGTYEDCFNTDDQGNCMDLLTPARQLCAVFEQCGYLHSYTEHHQGHSWGLWRDTLADALTYLMAGE